MKKLKVFLMGGTKDSVDIIKHLKKDYNVYILTTTTTEYGSKLAILGGSDEVIARPLPKDQILEILNKNKFDVFIDATHPFASHVTKTAIECSEIMELPYIRFERPISKIGKMNVEKLHVVKSFEDARKLIVSKWNQDNILHLAGSNTMEFIVKSINPKNFYPRILNIESSIKKCEELKIPKENIFFMNGVSTEKENIDLIKKIDAKVIISKESGKTGGLSEKLNAAIKTNIDFILIERPIIKTLKKENTISNLNDLDIKLNQLI